MAVDIFLKLDPVKGESKDDKHKDEMDVLHWSWGMAQSGVSGMGGGGGAGKVHVNDLQVTKYVDKASTDLMKSCCNGKHFAKAILTVRKAGEKPLEYFILTMEDVLISSVSSGASGGEDRFTENVALNFAKFKVKYVEQNKDGTGGAPSEMDWNIEGNVAM